MGQLLGTIWTNTTPAVDETLQENDTGKVLEELLEAQNQSHVLGLQLNLPLHDVEAIHLQYQNPRNRLLHIIIAFLRQAEPRPTWRVIVEALRNPTVNLPALARRVQAAHFPDPTATHAPPTASGKPIYTHHRSYGTPFVTKLQLLVSWIFTCYIFLIPRYSLARLSGEDLRGMAYHKWLVNQVGVSCKLHSIWPLCAAMDISSSLGQCTFRPI